MLSTHIYAWKKAFKPMYVGGPDNNSIFLCRVLVVLDVVLAAAVAGIAGFLAAWLST